MVASDFIAWLSVAPQKRWLDVGCGTGALTQAILGKAGPESVDGIDASADFVEFAQIANQDKRASFLKADVKSLLSWERQYDAVVSGLFLNFPENPDEALDGMARVVSANGIIGAYVWDYSDKMEFLRYFWDSAIELDSDAARFDEGRQFPICGEKPLKKLFEKSGLRKIEIRHIDIKTRFSNFGQFWVPFDGGVGPAPAYVALIGEAKREALKAILQRRLPAGSDGAIELTARAWAVKGLK